MLFIFIELKNKTGMMLYKPEQLFRGREWRREVREGQNGSQMMASK